MQSLYRYVSGPEVCSYLPFETAQLEYVGVARLDAREYGELMLAGWRRFGRSLFRPRCRACSACRSLRIDANRFRPDRSQRRALAANDESLSFEIGRPVIDQERLELYDRFHEHRTITRGWSMHEPGDWIGYQSAFLDNPFPTEEWRFRLEGELIGVGYVDPLPIGLSAIYYFHEPTHLARSLGTYNILKLIEETASRGLPHVYLGYHVEGCGSLAYKARFQPYERLDLDGLWSAPSGAEHGIPDA